MPAYEQPPAKPVVVLLYSFILWAPAFAMRKNSSYRKISSFAYLR